MLISVSLFAQKITLSGTVKNKSGETLIGAVILEKGTSNGTITDVDGQYKLDVSNPAIIQCSMLGYNTEEISIDGIYHLDIILGEDTKALDEVVVIGYGTAKKSDLTSSISSVSSDDISSYNSGNAMNALQTKVNGVQITNSGTPGSSPRVIIRGVTTVNGSDPLYVVDGMPVGTNINFLNPEDVESMEVLKDASASAIYGTRASNGVILITTKKGKAGKTRFQFTSNIGIGILGAPDMAGAAEYEQVFKMRYTNDGQVSPYNGKNNIKDSDGTDWWAETVNKTAVTQNYNLSFQGGSDKVIFSGSLGYYRADANYDYGYWEKLTGRINTEFTFNKHVKLGVDLAPKVERWDDTPNLMGAAMNMDPTTPVYRDEKDFSDNVFSNFARSNNNQTHNPVASLSRMTAHSDEYGLIMNPYLNIEIVKGLTFRTQFGDNARFRLSNNYAPDFFIDNLEQAQVSNVNRKMTTWNDWNWTNTLNYTTQLDKHSINLMAGYTMEKFGEYWIEGSRDAVPSNNPNLQYLNAGTENQKASGTDRFNTLVSYLGRAMYNYDGRYYLTASIRFDGSSKFPEGNKYATFPAISAAWKINNESFMQNQTIFNTLKLRMGWGRVGNQNIDNSAYLSTIGTTYYVVNGAMVTGSAVTSTANPNIQWETVDDMNLGLEMGFLNDRLRVDAELYKKKTKDMLLKEAHMLYLGYPEWAGEIWTNVGSMEASGWELSINWQDNITSNLKYNVGVNLSGVKNKAKDLGLSSPINTEGFNGDYIIRNETDAEICRFFGYKSLGIFQNWEEVASYTNEHGDLLQPYAQPGDLKFCDLNHDGKLDADDKTYIGNAFPKLYMGINLGLNYKQWDFGMNFYGTFGNDIFNTTMGKYSGVAGENVFAGTFDKAWWYEGQKTDIPRLSYNDKNGNYTTVSDWFVESGSYLRCKQVQVGYTIPAEKLGGRSLRLSVSAQNLFTLTSYSGMDPETAMTGGVTSCGVDWVAYPNPRTIIFGVNFNF